MIEIRWHGRGGQGAKTIALLFADAALQQGKFIQAFPEYGPERMGAPVTAFNRISDRPIRLHSGVTNPHIVVVLDPTLIGVVDVLAGLDPKTGTIVVNTTKTPAAIRQDLKFGGKVCTIDAMGIATACIGKPIPNMPMLGAMVKATGLLQIEPMLAEIKAKIADKFKHKPEVIEGNLKAVRRSFEEVNIA
ncbi:MAG: Pyruvate:ferredoxin oxidoreductase, gamma subunit [Candidatus Ozemobacter sibiricus]|uniref:Pyruvate:ferredoxin oxidoreductase, gamma subunit n=1 Tax=Candidatus Ozemobacter sibiricus TaxID=2268124 RepID=A0A367ZR79_9BACT|nr:MAG: Pyruvate:ferredoxin oxidoreductase, gamma subunit [Candidatus Ozemobacter sibiricus]